MATGLYVGVNDASKKILKSYVGVDGLAKNVKKIYVGVNGQAKLAYQDKIVKEVFKVTSANSANDTVRGVSGGTNQITLANGDIRPVGTKLGTKYYNTNFYTATDSQLLNSTMYAEFEARITGWQSGPFSLSWDYWEFNLNRSGSYPNDMLMNRNGGQKWTGNSILNNKAYGQWHKILYELPIVNGKISGTVKVYVDNALYASTTIFNGDTAPKPFGNGFGQTGYLSIDNSNSHLKSIHIWGEIK